MAKERFFYDPRTNAFHNSTPSKILKRWIEVPRMPEDGERWEKGRFVTDHAVAADMAVPADHKPAVHTQKAIEAALLLSGVPLTHGLLAEEAKAIGVDLHALAEQVYAHAADQRATEIARRKRKTQKAAGGKQRARNS